MTNIVSLPGYNGIVKELGQRGFRVVGKTLVRKGKVYSMPRSVQRALNSSSYSGLNFKLMEIDKSKPTPAIKAFFKNESPKPPKTFKSTDGQWTIYSPRSAGIVGGSCYAPLPKKGAKASPPLAKSPKKATYVLTDNVVSFFNPKDGCGYAASKANPMFSDLLKALDDNNLDKAVKLVSIANEVEVVSAGLIKNDGGILKHKNEELNETVTDYLVRNMGRNDGVIQAVINFMAKCNKNPSRASVDAMWRFVRKNGLILFPDGDLLCYRYCSDDFKDLHSGKFDNSIGKICKMPREEVDDNNNIHCSKGLHAQSYHNVMNSSTVIEVKVSPENVVSIPVGEDWKMRCCEFMSWKLLRHKGIDVAERTKEFVAL